LGALVEGGRFRVIRNEARFFARVELLQFGAVYCSHLGTLDHRKVVKAVWMERNKIIFANLSVTSSQIAHVTHHRKSRMISRAALAPLAPVRPLPGWVPEPQRNSPRMGVL